MENIIILAIVNLIALLVFGRGATRSVVGYARLLIVVALTVALAGIIAAITGETRVSHSFASQAAASLLLAALASVLTVAIATVRFAIAAVAAAVSVIYDRRAAYFRAEADKASATESWSEHPAWCRKVASEYEAASEAASRWLYRD